MKWYQHPRIYEVSALLLFLVVFGAFFSFYTGFSVVSFIFGSRTVDQAIVTVESPSQLNSPPILRVPAGSLLQNATYNVAQNGGLTVYMWIFRFQNSSFHPLTIREPVYQYWQSGTVPFTYSMYAVYARAHYGARNVFGGWTLVNGTRLVISFSNLALVPTVGGGLIASLLKPQGNVTTLSNIQPLLDPGIPYNATAPPDGGPFDPDPWSVIHSSETVLNGVLYGSVFGGPAAALYYGAVQFIFNPFEDKTLREIQTLLRGTVPRKAIPELLLKIVEGE